MIPAGFPMMSRRPERVRALVKRTEPLPVIASAKKPPKGLLCPRCGEGLKTVTDSRPMKGGIYRRKMCRNGHRVTTEERIRSEEDSFDPVI